MVTDLHHHWRKTHSMPEGKLLHYISLDVSRMAQSSGKYTVELYRVDSIVMRCHANILDIWHINTSPALCCIHRARWTTNEATPLLRVSSDDIKEGFGRSEQYVDPSHVPKLSTGRVDHARNVSKTISQENRAILSLNTTYEAAASSNTCYLHFLWNMWLLLIMKYSSGLRKIDSPQDCRMRFTLLAIMCNLWRW